MVSMSDDKYQAMVILKPVGGEATVDNIVTIYGAAGLSFDEAFKAAEDLTIKSLLCLEVDDGIACFPAHRVLSLQFIKDDPVKSSDAEKLRKVGDLVNENLRMARGTLHDRAYLDGLRRDADILSHILAGS